MDGINHADRAHDRDSALDGSRLDQAEAGAAKEHAPQSPSALIAGLPWPEYSYLLGIYLGDGTLSRLPARRLPLRIVMDIRYPGIIAECVAAMRAVMPA